MAAAPKCRSRVRTAYTTVLFSWLEPPSRGMREESQPAADAGTIGGRFLRVVSRFARYALPFVLIILALTERTAFAQGPLANGDTFTGTIAPAGQIDIWSFSAAQGDFIALAIGEVVAIPDPGFQPLIQLQVHDTGTVIAPQSVSSERRLRSTPR